MGVHKETLEEIKGRIDIEGVIGDFVPLKQRGSSSSYWGCCPFHNEKNPSFVVNREKGFYKCFGCGKGGDAIRFLQDKEGMSYIESMRYLAEKYGVIWKEDKDAHYVQEADTTRESLHILLELAAQHYQEELKKSSKAQDYLAKRGIDQALIKKFAIGYSTTSWQGLQRHAQKKGYTDEMLEEAGLLVRKEEKRYDRLRGRITFLLRQSSGTNVGISGRILYGKADDAKYINPPETLLYQKKKFLYGLYEGKKAIRKEQNCYLVEGYTDVLALHKAGVEAVVASSGTSLTHQQVRLLMKFTSKITILFDGDEAGHAALLRGIDIILQEGVEVKVVLLPQGEDPDSYIKKHGKTHFREYIQSQAQDFVTFKMHNLLDKEEKDPEKESIALQKVMRSLALIPDAVRRGVYMSLASKLSGLSKETVEEAVADIRSRTSAVESPHKNPSKVKNFKELLSKKSKYEHNEEALLHLLFYYFSYQVEEGHPLLSYLIKELEDVPFRREENQRLLAFFKEKWEKNKDMKFSSFLDFLPEKEKDYLINIMASPLEMSEQWAERYHILIPKKKEIITQLIERNLLYRKKYFVEELLHEQRLLLSKAKNEEEVALYIQRHQNIKAIDIQISSSLGCFIAPIDRNSLY